MSNIGCVVVVVVVVEVVVMVVACSADRANWSTRLRKIRVVDPDCAKSHLTWLGGRVACTVCPLAPLTGRVACTVCPVP